MTGAEILAAIFGGGGALATIGAGVKFIWDKIEARFTKIEAELAECRARELMAVKREADSRERRAKQITVIELLWQKVKDIDPSAAVLDRAKHLLDELKETAALAARNDGD
jgi:Na+-translocating ferredoxin:NAD+ oxidoreductase RnfC subunit